MSHKSSSSPSKELSNRVACDNESCLHTFPHRLLPRNIIMIIIRLNPLGKNPFPPSPQSPEPNRSHPHTQYPHNKSAAFLREASYRSTGILQPLSWIIDMLCGSVVLKVSEIRSPPPSLPHTIDATKCNSPSKRKYNNNNCSSK